jgi:hypothetical protein
MAAGDAVMTSKGMLHVPCLFSSPCALYLCKDPGIQCFLQNQTLLPATFSAAGGCCTWGCRATIRTPGPGPP